MKRFLLSCTLLVVFTESTAIAAFTTSGNISPTNPSTWTSSTTGYVGNTATGTLTVNGGSDLLSKNGYLGYSSGVTGTVTVDGSGSTWTNSSNIIVGTYGSGTLSISDGGYVSCSGGTVGYNSGSTGTVTVDGSGSTWTNSGYINVGNSGSGTLKISNGGSVSVVGQTYVAYNNGSTGSINFGTNGGTLTTQSLWASPSQLTGTGTINARGLLSDIDLVFDATHGLTQTITLNSLPDQNIAINLDLSGSSSTNGYIGAGYKGTGSLTIKDGITITSNYYGYLGYNSSSTGTATVDGSGSKWAISSPLYVGYNGNGTLNISNGGSVSNYDGYIGQKSSFTGTVTVDGSGSTWTNSSSLYVGKSGSGTLNIINGGSVSTAVVTYVGRFAGSTGAINFGTSGGTLTTRSLWASPSQLTGTGTINARGLLSDIDLVFDVTHGLTRTITLNSLTDQNISINLDMGSSPSTNGDLGAGYNGMGSLTIKSGIEVKSNYGNLGYRSGSIGTAMVDGSGSKWTNSADLYIACIGSGTLTISNGGSVSNLYGYVGEMTGSTGTAKVDGAGSMWSNGGSLYVGYSGSGTLNISNGGSVSDTSGYVGYNSYSTGRATVEGTGSKWSNGGSLYVGYSGSGTLNISNGGSVSNNSGYVGYGYQSAGTVNVDGAGSTWTNSSSLNISNGTLNISNGGSVSSVSGHIETGLNTMVTVDGSGSTWTISGFLDIGQYYEGMLKISNGGVVNSTYGNVNRSDPSTITVTVDGSGSKWINSGSLSIGKYGDGSLRISNGGSVSNGDCYIGYATSGLIGNTVTMEGSGTTWANSGSLYVGYIGIGNSIVNQNGGINSIAGILYLSNTTHTNGTYNLNGGTLILKSLISGGSWGIFNFGGGTLQASGAFSSSVPMKLTSTGGNANIDTAGYPVTLSGVLSGIGGLNKLGSGTLTLSNVNTFNGAVNFNGGFINASALNKLGTGTALNFNGGGVYNSLVCSILRCAS